MKSLFLRMFFWCCGTTTLVAFAIAAGYVLANPDQLSFAWPRVGRGAILSSGRMAVRAYEQGGTAELTRYLESLRQDTGLRGTLFDLAGRQLGSSGFADGPPEGLASQAESKLVFRVRGRLAAVRLRGSGGSPYAFVVSVPRRAGMRFWVRISILAFIVGGGLLCYFLARHVSSPVIHLRALTSRFTQGDLKARITEPRVLDRRDEIGGLVRDFNRMAACMETLVKAQQRLIADVSHELRSPITRLSLALGLMRRTEPGHRTSLARMEREVDRLNALITQLLTLSRLECMDQPPPMQAIELAALVREIASDADFEAANIDRNVRLLECAACSMQGAPDLIRSAVENIVRNALRYTPPNTQVSVRLQRVNGGQTATIVVADQGPGVPAEVLEHMFEPFYRVDEARDRRSGGVGLGLAIARQIVTLHGGAIQAANRDAGGLEMQITLPVEPVF